MHPSRSWLIIGPVAATGYAAAMVLLVTVWDPAAAVPAMPYADIVRGLQATGVNVTATYVGLSLWGAIGPAAAVVVSILGMRGRLSGPAVIASQLAILAAGAPALFIASFPLGMDVADTFSVRGGAHTPVTGMLYSVSAAALITLIVVAVVQGRRTTQRPNV